MTPKWDGCGTFMK